MLRWIQNVQHLNSDSHLLKMNQGVISVHKKADSLGSGKEKPFLYLPGNTWLLLNICWSIYCIPDSV